MARGERDELGLLIDLADDVARANAAEGGDVQKLNGDAAVGELHPWVNVGWVIIQVGEDGFVFLQFQPASDVAEGEAGGADEGDLGWFAADKLRGEGAGLRDDLSGQGMLLVAPRAGMDVGFHGGGDTAGERANARVREEDFLPDDREFVRAEFFVSVQFRNGHVQ